MRAQKQGHKSESTKAYGFSRRHATIPYFVGRYVLHNLNSEPCLHHCPCLNCRYCLAMYLTLFLKLYLTLNVSLCCQSCVCDSKSCNVARSFGPSQLAFLAFLIVFCTAPESSPSALVSLFRCIRQERIYIRGSVRPSARPSIGRLVRYACAKTVFLGCFWPRWIQIPKKMINKHVLRASFTT